MKALGAEINAFYRDWPLGDEWYHDEGTADVDEDGDLLLEPGQKHDLGEVIGYLAWQGESDQPNHVRINGKKISTWTATFLDQVFKAWRHSPTHEIVVLSVPSDQVENLLAFAREHGCNVKR